MKRDCLSRGRPCNGLEREDVQAKLGQAQMSRRAACDEDLHHFTFRFRCPPALHFYRDTHQPTQKRHGTHDTRHTTHNTRHATHDDARYVIPKGFFRGEREGERGAPPTIPPAKFPGVGYTLRRSPRVPRTVCRVRGITLGGLPLRRLRPIPYIGQNWQIS